MERQLELSTRHYQELLQLEIRSPFSQILHFLEENLAQRVWRDRSSKKGLETRNGCINKQTVFFLGFICNRAAAVGSVLLREDVKKQEKSYQTCILSHLKRVPCPVS